MKQRVRPTAEAVFQEDLVLRRRRTGDTAAYGPSQPPDYPAPVRSMTSPPRRMCVNPKTAPTYETRTMPKALAELGHQLTGAADSIAVEEAISSLDHIRKAAFTDNVSAMDMKPPVLLCDNLEPSSFFLHNQKVSQEEFKKGLPNLFSIPDLGVLGGCMMHTQRCCFPVVVLHSATDDVMLLYCPRSPIAALEAEMYDSAFDPNPSTWEATVLREEANEVMGWRREAAVSTRKVGYDQIPKFMCGDDDIYITRHGAIPYLSLRAVDNEGEYQMVHKAVHRVMRILPAASKDRVCPDEKENKSRGAVLLGTTFLTGDVPCPREITERTPEKKEVDQVCMRSIITMVAYNILQYGMDNATDHNGSRISEYHLALPWHADQLHCFQLQFEKERYFKEIARYDRTVTDVWQSVNHDESYSLPALMKRMGRSFITQPIVDGDAVATAGDNVVRTVMEAVAIASFNPKDADFVLGTCTKLSESSMTVPSAISVLGKCLMESQAIMIASRDQDGRFGQVKLVGSGGTIAQVNKHNFARLACLCPWVTTFIIDKGQVVSLLCVKDPAHVREAMSGKDTHNLDRQKLGLREGAGAAQGPSVAAVKGLSESVEKLKENLEAVTGELKTTKKDAAFLKESYDSHIIKLQAWNESLETSVKELTRKVDVLLTRAMQEPGEGAVQPPACLNTPPRRRMTSDDMYDFLTQMPMPDPDSLDFQDEDGFMQDEYDKAMRQWQHVKDLLQGDVEGDPVVIVSDDRDPTVLSLKRSLEAIEALHKRMRK